MTTRIVYIQKYIRNLLQTLVIVRDRLVGVEKLVNKTSQFEFILESVLLIGAPSRY